MEVAPTSCLLLNLPNEIIIRIINQLYAHEIDRLLHCCKQLQHVLLNGCIHHLVFPKLRRELNHDLLCRTTFMYPLRRWMLANKTQLFTLNIKPVLLTHFHPQDNFETCFERWVLPFTQLTTLNLTVDLDDCIPTHSTSFVLWSRLPKSLTRLSINFDTSTTGMDCIQDEPAHVWPPHLARLSLKSMDQSQQQFEDMIDFPDSITMLTLKWITIDEDALMQWLVAVPTHIRTLKIYADTIVTLPFSRTWKLPEWTTWIHHHAQLSRLVLQGVSVPFSSCHLFHHLSSLACGLTLDDSQLLLSRDWPHSFLLRHFHLTCTARLKSHISQIRILMPCLLTLKIDFDTLIHLDLNSDVDYAEQQALSMQELMHQNRHMFDFHHLTLLTLKNVVSIDASCWQHLPTSLIHFSCPQLSSLDCRLLQYLPSQLQTFDCPSLYLSDIHDYVMDETFFTPPMKPTSSHPSLNNLIHNTISTTSTIISYNNKTTNTLIPCNNNNNQEKILIIKEGVLDKIEKHVPHQKHASVSLFHSNNNLDIQLFPTTLINLNIAGWIGFMDHHMQYLPPDLKYLSWHQCAPKQFTNAMFKQLPRHLTHFSMLCDNHNLDMSSDALIDLPRRLEKLYLYGLQCRRARDLSHLPPTLQYVGIVNFTLPLSDHDRWHYFPPNLRRIRIPLHNWDRVDRVDLARRYPLLQYIPISSKPRSNIISYLMCENNVGASRRCILVIVVIIVVLTTLLIITNVLRLLLRHPSPPSSS